MHSQHSLSLPILFHQQERRKRQRGKWQKGQGQQQWRKWQRGQRRKRQRQQQRRQRQRQRIQQQQLSWHPADACTTFSVSPSIEFYFSYVFLYRYFHQLSKISPNPLCLLRLYQSILFQNNIPRNWEKTYFRNATIYWSISLIQFSVSQLMFKRTLLIFSQNCFFHQCQKLLVFKKSSVKKDVGRLWVCHQPQGTWRPLK